MNNYLRLREWKFLAEPLSPGEKIRHNHQSDDCDGDSNSMIIERKENGDLAAHCFRCGKRGFYSENIVGKRLFKETHCPINTGVGDGGTRGNDVSVIPNECRDVLKDINEWPIEARVWVRRFGISDQECRDNDIYYSEGLSRIVIQKHDGEGLAGCVTRRVYEYDLDSVKYRSYQDRPTSIIVPASSTAPLSDDCLVLVEDMLSAIKVARNGLDCLCLYGTSLSDQSLAYISHRGYSRFIIFLDDDNSQVKRNGLKILRKLEKLGQGRIIKSNGRDPKEHSNQELREIFMGLCSNRRCYLSSSLCY